MKTASIRNDVCYYLDLSQYPRIIPAIKTLINDDDNVRETAHKTLAELKA